MATVTSDSSMAEFRTVPRVREWGDEDRNPASAVSWGAIFAGAASAAVLSLVLVLLGTGLGLSAVSPWNRDSFNGTAMGIMTMSWVLLTQILSAILGGYVAGRLRAKWVAAHTDEVRFRDTAHGFLAWAVASLAIATMFASGAGSVASGGAKAATAAATAIVASAAGGAAAMGTKTAAAEPTGYFVDSLFRPAAGQTASSQTVSGQATRTANGGSGVSTSNNGESAQSTEAARIFANGLKAGSLPADDMHYLAQVVALRTGMSQTEAETRVNETYARLQQTMQQAEDTAKREAETARKAAVQLSLWLVMSLFVGAFVACWAATSGGRMRDLPAHQH